MESPISKTGAVDLVVVDLSGHELFRQSTDTIDALPSLHSASAQVAFWRHVSGAAYDLVIWNIATKALKVIATSPRAITMRPIWSVAGTEIVSTPNTPTPTVPFQGRAAISIATVSTGQYRTLALDRPLLPLFADGKVVAGYSFDVDRKYVVVDLRSGRTLHELDLAATVGILPTVNRDVVLGLGGTSTPGVFTLHALDARTGSKLSDLGELVAGPVPSWPGRNEVVFVAAGQLKAFDYTTNSSRSVGRLDGAVTALGFDDLGKILLYLAADRPGMPVG